MRTPPNRARPKCCRSMTIWKASIPASGYLVGDRLTLADIAVASPFVNTAHCGIVPDAATYPKLTAYLAAIWARPGFATWIPRERKMLGLG
jgi:glutathione S-transferase